MSLRPGWPLPPSLRWIESFAVAFTRPTFSRFVLLTVAAILAMGRRTVSRLLWVVPEAIRSGHFSSYHRVFSRARWSMLPLGRVLAAVLLELVPRDAPVILAGDDTTAEHRGKHVFGKACHRDAVHSTGGKVQLKWGHKWVALAVLVKLPFCKRAWALPVLSALHVPPSTAAATPLSRSRMLELRKRDQKTGKLPARDKTPPLLMRQMLATLMHWFPERRFILTGDWGYGSHELAWFCHRHRRRVTLVARFRGDAVLHALPGDKPCKSRRHSGHVRKGRRLPAPAEIAGKAAGRRKATVRWYGNSVRDVELLSACAGWYRARGGGRAALVPIRWVFCKELVNGEEGYFFSTDPLMTPEQIVELYAGRWAIEVTFQEVRAHLGFQTTRQRCRASVLRSGACLLGLFSVVSMTWAKRVQERGQVSVGTTPCYAKTDPTFGDALASVRRVLWEQVLLPQLPGGRLVTALPPPLRELLLDRLAAAA